MKKCSTCGRAFDDTWEVCLNCREPLEKTHDDYVPPKYSVSESTKVWNGFFMVAVIVAIAFCIFGIGLFLRLSCGSVTFPAPFDGRVSFSPDGRHLICGIRGSNDGGGGIHRMNKDWTNPIKLTTPAPKSVPMRWYVYTAYSCDGYPTYSPDGLKIVYTRHPSCNRAEAGHLFIMNADGTNPTQLTSGPYLDTAPVFSPDGQHIYFLREWDKDGRGSFIDAARAIYSMRSDGTDAQRITGDNYEYVGAPAISPDGKHLAFPARPDRYGPVYLNIMFLENNKNEITKQKFSHNMPDGIKWENYTVEDPVYSPDGKYLLFNISIWSVNQSGVQTGGAINAICRFNLETKATEQIADVSMFGWGWPSISPDGKTIIFLEYDSSLGGIFKSFWSVNSDGSNPRQIRLNLKQA